MTVPVVSVITVLDMPGLVASSQNIECCPLFGVCSPFSDATYNRSSLAYFSIDPSWRVDHLWGK
jgi:hypothetical protein